MDFVRPLLMPLLVVMIVASVWALGWSQEIDDKRERATRPVDQTTYLADAAADDADQP